MKSTIDGLKNMVGNAEEQISDLEDRVVKSNQDEEQREK